MPSSCRLHLVAPEIAPGDAAACLEAACDAGDIASIVVPPALVATLAPIAQRRDVALIVMFGVPIAREADGVEVTTADDCREARRALANGIVGGHAGTSRHLAMELAEAGADYIAFAQNRQTSGESILAWWADVFEIPCIAADPVEPGQIATLLTQRPDFIRPSGAMWQSAGDSRRIIEDTMRAIAEAPS